MLRAPSRTLEVTFLCMIRRDNPSSKAQLSKLRVMCRREFKSGAVSGRGARFEVCFGAGPLPPGEGGAKRRVRAVRCDQSYSEPDISWGGLPSSGASRHLLPEGEGPA